MIITTLRRILILASLPAALFPGLLPVTAQTVEITNDQSVPITGVQTVNVGEHVRLRVRAVPTGTTFTNPVWVITGAHLRDWVTKDAEPIPLTADDYMADAIHFVWQETTSLFAPDVVRITALVGGSPVSAEAHFNVVRSQKPEKYYSDDFLMENHNNWHSVYMFATAATRRGDLFLAWHRSQLDHYNRWRQYFGYGPVRNWTPSAPWSASLIPEALRHPSNPAPVAGFSQRHDLTTLDLTDQTLTTSSEGQFDLVTQAQASGTTSQFAAANYTLTTDAVGSVIGIPTGTTGFTRVGVVTTPSWWAPNSGQSGADPWYSLGCPALATPIATMNTSTCSSTSKRSFDDYTLRELGESIESGLYAADFRINYHALGHIAASIDMANPITSMRDPIFWGWHYWIDSLMTTWQATRGVEATGALTVYQIPNWTPDWTAVNVPFSHRVVPEFVRPANVLVNGSPATTVTDVSLTGTGYIFRFSGFPVPPTGPVEVVLRRETDNTIRTSPTMPRPMPTVIFSTYGNILQPAVSRFTYTRP
jgi:tyrosinase-like protein